MIHYHRARYHANLAVYSPIGDYVELSKLRVYTVRVRQLFFGRIQAQIMRDDDPSRELVGARITYPTLFHFFEDWEPLQVSLSPHDLTFNGRLLENARNN